MFAKNSGKKSGCGEYKKITIRKSELIFVRVPFPTKSNLGLLHLRGYFLDYPIDSEKDQTSSLWPMIFCTGILFASDLNSPDQMCHFYMD